MTRKRAVQCGTEPWPWLARRWPWLLLYWPNPTRRTMRQARRAGVPFSSARRLAAVLKAQGEGKR